MRAQISVIVPTLDAEPRLAACFGALLEGLEAGIVRELIVSDGGSRDATGAVAQAWGAEVLHGNASRGAQLCAGAQAAQGEWLLFLHADTVLSQGWSAVARAHLTRQSHAGWFQLAFDARGAAPATVAAWANLRSRLGLPYGDQGLLIHRSLYNAVGGYPDQPLMEDVAIARALRGHLQGLGAVATTSADRYRDQGWIRRGGRNLLTLARYGAGTSPETLAKAYRRKT